jgi:intracellular septation protein
MQQLIELAPLVAFFAAWALGGIYVATAVLMGAMLLLLCWDWLTTRKLPTMHLLSTVLVWVFGAATLILHNARFIQWKATVFYWLLAVVLAGSIWIGRVTLLERLMGKALPEGMKVEPRVWRNLSLVCALFYFAMGGVNIWIAYNMSEKAWVLFKSWLSIPLLFLFNVAIVFWLMRGHEEKDNPEQPT